MANKQYRLTEAEWLLVQEIREMNFDTFLDIIVALRNESRELEKKVEFVQEAKQTGWEEESEAIKERIRLLNQFERDFRKARPIV